MDTPRIYFFNPLLMDIYLFIAIIDINIDFLLYLLTLELLGSTECKIIKDLYVFFSLLSLLFL